MSFECLDCKAIDGGYCSDCATHNDELRRLIEDWRDDKREPPARHPSIWRTYRNCAGELEELIE